MNRYETLAADLESAIRGGVIRPGERLPSVRQTSTARRVSMSTVFQAYYLLEARGLVEARERSGYFVTDRANAKLPPVPFKAGDSGPISTVSVSDAVFSMLEAGTRPHVVPLGSPFPDPTLFPLARLGRSMAASARNYTARGTVDDITPGKESLRRLIAQRYIARGVTVHPDEIVITNGALEALNLSLATVARPGDAIAVESPAFYGALQAIERLGMRAVEVPTHPETGVDLDALEHAFRERGVKACWLMPTFQNPLGATMPDASKEALVALLRQYGVPLVEDDVYGELHFGGQSPRPAKAWDRDGLVLHCGSFSKTLAPGYRIGWVAPGAYMRDLARQKVAATLMASMPAQLGLVDYLRRGGFDLHLRKLRQTLAARYDEVAGAVSRHFPEGTCATEPRGAYFMWVQMPPQVDAFELFRQGKEHKICIAPGPVFSSTGGFRNCVRLNFSHGLTPRVDNALRIIGRLAREACERPAAHDAVALRA